MQVAVPSLALNQLALSVAPLSFFRPYLVLSSRSSIVSPMSPSPTPPPSYSSRSSTKSSSSTKRKSSSTEKDKEKVKDRDKDKADRDVKVKDRDSPPREGDDVFSIRSKSSAVSSGTASSTQSTVDILRLIAGSGVRRSKCRAEFLEELAKGSGLAALDEDIAERLKIITGKEGIAFFRRFIGCVFAFVCPWGFQLLDSASDIIATVIGRN